MGVRPACCAGNGAAQPGGCGDVLGAVLGAVGWVSGRVMKAVVRKNTVSWVSLYRLRIFYLFLDTFFVTLINGNILGFGEEVGLVFRNTIEFTC